MLRRLKWRARQVSEERAEASRPALPLDISVAVVAQDCRAELAGLIENVAGFAREIVVVDGGSVDGTLELCREDPRVRLFERRWDGHFGRQKNLAIGACEGQWVLHLDTDERIGPRLRSRLPKLCSGRADFYRVPMYWLVSEQPARYVDSPKHYPCWVPRLFRNLPEFRYLESDPVHVRFPAEVVKRMQKVHGAHIFHYCFAWLDREALLEKAARYLHDHPGTEDTTRSYYLWWLESHKLRDCEEQPD